MGEIELLKEFKQKWTKREIRKDTSQNIENNSDAPRGTRLLELLERIYQRSVNLMTLMIYVVLQ